MSVIVRALGIGLAAIAAYLLMNAFDDGEGGANIGAGLAVFAVLVVVSFVWAVLDGSGGLSEVGRRRAGSVRVGLGALLLRWVVASVLAVALLVAAMMVLQGSGYLADVGPSVVVFLVLLALVPAVVGVAIGYAARSATRTSGPDGPEPGPDGPGQTRSS